MADSEVRSAKANDEGTVTDSDDAPETAAAPATLESPDDGAVETAESLTEEVEAETLAESETPEEPAPEPVIVPAAEWAAAQEAVRAAEDRLLRLQAEFENYRRRTAKERLQARDGAIEEVARSFLHVVDNFDRAVAAAADYEMDEEHLSGWRLIHQQLYDVLRSHGVEPMAVIGRPFDPQYHDALAEVEDDDIPAGHVAAEVERGYMVGDRVLRTAKVTVCRGPAADTT